MYLKILIYCFLCILNIVRYCEGPVADFRRAYYFCNFKCGRMHTVCRRDPCHPTSKCGVHVKTSLSLREKRIILSEHNNLRNRIALGEDKRGGNTKASNMRALSYSKELEFVAQCWSNACEYAHDKCRATKLFQDVGQNIYMAAGQENYKEEIHLRKAVKFWYEQIGNVSKTLLTNWTNKGSYAFEAFTQLAWAKTTHVGCGRTIDVSISGKLFIVCNYGPKGNWFGEATYEMGPICSKCGETTAGDPIKCNVVMQGLCGKAKISEEDMWYIPITGAKCNFVNFKLLMYLLFLCVF